MYGVILATAMTVSAGTPAWTHHHHGCYGCYGSWGNCYGCNGCYGCYGSSGYAFSSCYGCYGGCYGSCYGCWGSCYGCNGCYGPTVLYYPATTYAVPCPVPAIEGAPSGGDAAQKEIQKLRKQLELLQQQLEMQKKKTERGRDEKTQNEAPSAPAQLTINLPANAKLFVDDVVCPLTSSTRSFATPALRPGQRFYYTIRAEVERDGTMLTQSKKVIVEAGQQVTVEFNSLVPAATASQR